MRTKTWDSNLKSADVQSAKRLEAFLMKQACLPSKGKRAAGQCSPPPKELVEILRLLDVNSVNLLALT